jgi:hypothetical protein
MTFHGARLGFVAVIMAMAGLPFTDVSASAGTFRTVQTTQSLIGKTTASKGSDPTGTFCRATRALDKAAGKGLNSSVFEKDVSSGHWSAAQKIILAALGAETNVFTQFPALLSAVPSKVRSGLEIEMRAFRAEERSIENDTSVSQFTSTSRTFGSSKSEIAAAKTIDTYTLATCGAHS